MFNGQPMPNFPIPNWEFRTSCLRRVDASPTRAQRKDGQGQRRPGRLRAHMPSSARSIVMMQGSTQLARGPAELAGRCMADMPQRMPCPP